jgi:dethiobiotin synthetase
VYLGERFLNALLIAGTDASVGKTVLITALVAYWQRYCRDRSIGVLKLVQTDDNADRQGRSVALAQAWQTLVTLSQQRDLVLVEAPGGLGTPVTPETTVADLAWDWRLPTVLVVPVQQGTINQAVAHVALAQQTRVYLKGIVLNCVQPCSEAPIADWAPTDWITSLTQKPVLGCIPYLSDAADLTKLAQVASNLDLERLLPL